MKKLFFFTLLTLSINTFGQNFVKNPDFENYIFCPDDWKQLSNCMFWSSYLEDADYFNACSPVTYLSPPNCHFGFQYPHSGNSYVGIYVYYSPPNNNRELIGSQLFTSLIVGEKYFLSFYVNLGGDNHATIASNKIGVKFSTVPYSYVNPAPINNTSHFYTNTIITDTAKWTRISGSFIADSAYSYIMLGNFFDDANTDTLNLSPTNNNYAYYYIDDVCVSADSLYCENWLGVKEESVRKEAVTIYPNPCINQLNVRFNIETNANTTISIIDITGKIILQVQTNESELVFNTEKLAKGLYLVKVESGGKVLMQKVTKE